MIANGMKFAFALASPITYTELEDLRDMGLPQETAARVDKTVHSTTSRRMRSEPGMTSVSDPYAVVLQDLSNAVQKQLRDLKAAGTLIYVRQEVPTNTECTLFVGFEYQAYVANFEPGGTTPEALQTTKYTFMVDSDIYEDSAEGATQIT